MEEGGQWKNFRSSHSDGKSYGDLDPRMGLDADNGFPLGKATQETGKAPPANGFPPESSKSVRPTSRSIRQAIWEEDQSEGSVHGGAPASAPGGGGGSGDRGSGSGHIPKWQEERQGVKGGRRPALPTLTVGTSLCHLVGIIVSKRRIGKTLMFLNLTCTAFTGHADPSSADKYAWQDASRGAAEGEAQRGSNECGVAVQLIIGRTVRERVGIEAAVEVLKGLRVGQLVYITGRMWVNGEKGQRNYEENATIDIVVSDIRVLEDDFRVDPLIITDSGVPPGSAPRIRLLDKREALVELRQAVREVRAAVKSKSALAARCSIGMDCEWQPGPRGGADYPVSLMQLATASHAFLLDLQTLCRSGMGEAEGMDETEAEVNSIIRELFMDKSIPIIGFGLRTDLNKLAESFPHMPCFWAAESIVDLKALLPSVFPGSPHLAQSIGLSKLASCLIGKKVDKSEQCSEWAVRPLTQSQMEYAALDAAVLLALLAPMAQESGTCRCETSECVQSCIFSPDSPRNKVRKPWARS
eukprot:gene25731-11390_t